MYHKRLPIYQQSGTPRKLTVKGGCPGPAMSIKAIGTLGASSGASRLARPVAERLQEGKGGAVSRTASILLALVASLVGGCADQTERAQREHYQFDELLGSCSGGNPGACQAAAILQNQRALEAEQSAAQGRAMMDFGNRLLLGPPIRF